MSDKNYDNFFLSSSSEIPETNAINYYSVPPMSDDQLRLWLQNAPFIPSFSTEDLQAQDHHHQCQSRFEISSSRKMDYSEINPCLDDTNLKQSSGTERKHVEIRTKEKDGCEKKKEVGDPDECKQRKRKRSNEVQNLNERSRRQKLAKKMKALQDMIPNSSKRDKASTIDEAIKYIHTLQYQVQMMSMGAGYSLFHSPPLMMPQPGHQIHSLTPFLHDAPTIIGMKYGIETGASSMFSPFNFPTSRFGLPNPCLFPSSSSSGATTLGSLYASGFPYFGSQTNKQGEASSSHDAKEMHKS